MPTSSLKKKVMAKKECEEKARIFNDYDDEYDQYEGMRNAAITKQEFEEVEQTSEFMETHYFKETSLDNYRNLISMSPFWADYANHLLNPVDARGSFISDNFVDCYSSKREIFLLQFILDLPATPSSDH